MYAADDGSAMQASLSAAIPLAYVLQSGFETLKVKKVALSVEAFDEKKQLQIDGCFGGAAGSPPGREGGAEHRDGGRRTAPR